MTAGTLIRFMGTLETHEDHDQAHDQIRDPQSESDS